MPSKNEVLCDDADSRASVIGESMLGHSLNQGLESEADQIDLLRSEPLSTGL